jgi:Lon protease-like protein
MRDLEMSSVVDPRALATLPMFPLPNCVLLPGGLLPLHVFEPRYRELTRDCLAGHHLMGIARLRPGAVTALADGKPPVYDRFGVGRIICSEELPDGRFALLLRGVARVELARELPSDRSYRQVEARVLTDVAVDPSEAGRDHHRLIALCDRLAELLDQGGAQLRDLVRGGDTPGACADAVAAALIMDADARQQLLEATCPLARLQRTLGHVSHLLCELAPCGDTVN